MSLFLFKKDKDRDRKWTVDTRDLIALLSKRLYPEKEAAIRELMQNAIDSQTDKIKIEATQLFVSVEDFGVGMSSEEVDKYLLAIGKSLKRLGSLADEDIQKTAANGKGPIGEFGIGFIASFCLSEWVLVETMKKNKTVLLLNKDGDIADLTKAKKGDKHVLNELEVRLAVGKIPLDVNSTLKELLTEKPKTTQGTRVTLINPKFDNASSKIQEAVEEEIKKRFASVDVKISINGIKIKTLKFEDYFTEKGVFNRVFELDVDGNLVLFVPGTIEKDFYKIFIKRVFNCEYDRWEGTQLLVNSATIKPTLSRDDVMEETYTPFVKNLRPKLVTVFLRNVRENDGNEELYDKIWRYTLKNLTLVHSLRIADTIKENAELKEPFGFVHLPIVHGYSAYPSQKWLPVQKLVNFSKEKKVLLYCDKKSEYVDKLAHDYVILDLEDAPENATTIIEHTFKKLYGITLKDAHEIDVGKDILGMVEQKDWLGVVLLIRDMLLHMDTYHHEKSSDTMYLNVVIAELRNRRGLYDPETDTIYLHVGLDCLRKIRSFFKYTHIYFPERPSDRIEAGKFLNAMRVRTRILDTSIKELYALVSHEFAHRLTETTERMHSKEFFETWNQINLADKYVEKGRHDKEIKTIKRYLGRADGCVAAITANMVKAGVEKERAMIIATNLFSVFIKPRRDRNYIEHVPKADRIKFLTAFGVCLSKTKLPEKLYKDIVGVFKAILLPFYDPTEDLTGALDNIMDGTFYQFWFNWMCDNIRELEKKGSEDLSNALDDAMCEILVIKHKEDVKSMFKRIGSELHLTESDYKEIFHTSAHIAIADLRGDRGFRNYAILLSVQDRIFSEVYGFIIKKQIAPENQYLLVDDAIRITALAKDAKFYFLPFLNKYYYEAVLSISQQKNVKNLDELTQKRLMARVFEFYEQEDKKRIDGSVAFPSKSSALECASKKIGISLPR